MTNPVSAISSIHGLEPLRSLEQPGKPGAFQSVLEGTIQQMESMNSDAAGEINKFLTGENEELHTTALAVQKAELAFELGLQVRNKVVSAYQEIMRMQM